jgi:pyruvyltransferase
VFSLIYLLAFPLFFWTPSSAPSNFGDALSPLIVERLLQEPPLIAKKGEKGPRFLALGSILHFAKDGDLIWGSGVNGKIPPSRHHFHTLDVRAVRGPLTRAFLLERGIPCPEVYGDPALLLPLLFPELTPDPQEEFILIPNLNEIAAYAHLPNVVLPTGECMEVVQRILRAKKVISGSLHGLIVAESFGIPAVFLRLTEKESLLKYQDYYEGTGRKRFPIAYSLEEALQIEATDGPTIDLEQLLMSFPLLRRAAAS